MWQRTTTDYYNFNSLLKVSKKEQTLKVSTLKWVEEKKFIAFIIPFFCSYIGCSIDRKQIGIDFLTKKIYEREVEKITFIKTYKNQTPARPTFDFDSLITSRNLKNWKNSPHDDHKQQQRHRQHIYLSSLFLLFASPMLCFQCSIEGWQKNVIYTAKLDLKKRGASDRTQWRRRRREILYKSYEKRRR